MQNRLPRASFLNGLRCMRCRHSGVYRVIHEGLPMEKLVYVEEGTGVFTSGDREITLAPGDLAIVPDGCRYRSVWTGSPQALFYSVWVNFHFDPHSVDPWTYPLQKIDGTDFGDFFRSLPERIVTRGRESWLALSDFYRIYPEILSRAERVPGTGRKLMTAPAVAYLAAFYTAPLRVARLAAICHLSEPRFYAVFRAENNCTPIVYKNRLCAEEAKYLLRTSDMTLGEIAERLGICSPNQLRSLLRRNFGMTPTELRQSEEKPLIQPE